MSDFLEFPKMARLSREIIVTEKLDGTNAQVLITEDGQIMAGSRTRWITPQDDNFGFAAWVQANKNELLKLGVGRHFGEWWGMGIQRKYGMTERKFSLFNVQRWAKHGTEPKQIPTGDPRIIKMQDVLPSCCDLVPVLFRGDFDTNKINECLDNLREFGSYASEGFMKPEGVVVFHTAGNVGFKKTLEKDELPKSVAKHLTQELGMVNTACTGCISDFRSDIRCYDCKVTSKGKGSNFLAVESIIKPKPLKLRPLNVMRILMRGFYEWR